MVWFDSTSEADWRKCWLAYPYHTITSYMCFPGLQGVLMKSSKLSLVFPFMLKPLPCNAHAQCSLALLIPHCHVLIHKRTNQGATFFLELFYRYLMDSQMILCSWYILISVSLLDIFGFRTLLIVLTGKIIGIIWRYSIVLSIKRTIKSTSFYWKKTKDFTNHPR